VHNYPWYTGWHKDYEKKGAVVIGIHTPETRDEAKFDRVRQKVNDNKMTYPIAIDNAGKTWEAWHNDSWPSIYLIDKKGRVRYRWVGELNWGETKGEPIVRKKIEELLAEKE
jgi:peroxiredoxin